jgi:putative membrane protein
MEEVIFRYFHFLGIISLASMLVCQNILLSKTVSGTQLKRLTVIDAWYGVSALAILASGISLVFLVGKPSEFYTQNILFHIKFGLFLFVALLSVVPTIFFIRNRKNSKSEKPIPNNVILLKRLELLVLFSIPLLAVLIARGIGHT